MVLRNSWSGVINISGTTLKKFMGILKNISALRWHKPKIIFENSRTEQFSKGSEGDVSSQCP